MNLLNDPFLTVRYRNGDQQRIVLADIVDPDIVDFAFPRADFTGAAYQFVISVLQTAFAPETLDDWEELYSEPPKKDELQHAFNKIQHAFNLSGDGPLFMQDFEPLLDVKKPSPVSGLLIEAPGGNTLKLNTDHFIKRGGCDHLSLPMAAMALFTLQVNAPSGGQGHRTGIRGGGPLTTLLMPNDKEASLWQKIWLNVLSREEWDYDEPDFYSEQVFPWLGATRQSKNKGTEVYASDVHPLHLYWAMPRRIRLLVDEQPETCALTGELNSASVSKYLTQNYGYNYSGSWWHPLTHYRTNPKKTNEENLSTKGQPGGISYKQWQPLTLMDQENGSHPAMVVQAYTQERFDYFAGAEGFTPRLWAFGYDMDNMKARGWYSAELPLFHCPKALREQLLTHVKQIQNIALEVVWHCRTQIKAAWFEKPADAKGDMSYIDQMFFQRTETTFYQLIQASISHSTSTEFMVPSKDANKWLSSLRQTALDLFDELVLSGIENGEGKNMKRIAKKRKELSSWLYAGKTVKSFEKEYLSRDKETAS